MKRQQSSAPKIQSSLLNIIAKHICCTDNLAPSLIYDNHSLKGYNVGLKTLDCLGSGNPVSKMLDKLLLFLELASQGTRHSQGSQAASRSRAKASCSNTSCANDLEDVARAAPAVHTHFELSKNMEENFKI